jgi:hypothetical protein
MEGALMIIDLISLWLNGVSEISDKSFSGDQFAEEFIKVAPDLFLNSGLKTRSARYSIYWRSHPLLKECVL